MYDTFGNPLMPGKEHLGGCIVGGDWGTFAPPVWDELISSLGAKSSIDVGCGAGHSVAYFLGKGLDAWGVEGFAPALEASAARDRMIEHDYCDGPLDPGREYDLAWCCEFVEHVEERFVDGFLATFARCRYVAMTHGVPGQDGYHHVNCQPAEYWIEKLASIGFEYMESESLRLRSLLDGPQDPPNLGCHIRNTLMLFSKKEAAL